MNARLLMLSLSLSVFACGPAGTEPLSTVAARITLSPSDLIVYFGRWSSIVARVYDAGGNEITYNVAGLDGRSLAWESSDMSVVDVSDTNGGTASVHARGVGSATVSVSYGGKSASIRVTVVFGVVARATVSPNAVALDPGQSLRLTVQLFDAEGNELLGNPVVWSSSESSWVRVSAASSASQEVATAVVTAVAAGAATITVSSGAATASAAVAVAHPPVARVTVVGFPFLFVGSSAEAWANTFDASGALLIGRSVTWTTSDSLTATVTSTGSSTAIVKSSLGARVGASVTITATSEGRSGALSWTVSAIPCFSVICR